MHITKDGLYELAIKSGNIEAIKLKNFITKELLPKLRKTEKYLLPTTRKHNQKSPTTIKHLLSSTIELNTDSIKSFYDDAEMEKYIGSSVVYIGVIGTYKHDELTGYILKYGITDDIGRRELKEHIAIYGVQFKIIYAIQTDNAKKVEAEFKLAMAMKRCNVELIFNYYMRTELFLTSSLFTIEQAIAQLEKIAAKNMTKAIRERDEKIRERDEKIKQLEYYNINAPVIEQAKVKQLELQLEILKHKKDLREIKMIENKAEPKIATEAEPEIAIKAFEPDLYLQFLDETTKNSKTHIHCSTLRDIFIPWIKKKNLGIEIPSNKSFVVNLKKHETIIGIIKAIKINNKSNLGLRNRTLI